MDILRTKQSARLLINEVLTYLLFLDYLFQKGYEYSHMLQPKSNSKVVHESSLQNGAVSCWGFLYSMKSQST